MISELSVHQRSHETGFSLPEVLCAMLACMFLVGGLLQAHAFLEGATRRELAHWQAHERVRMAALVLEHELRMAGFWGDTPFLHDNRIPDAIQGGQGVVICASARCVSPYKDQLIIKPSDTSIRTGASDALIIRYAREVSDHLAEDLPAIAFIPAPYVWRFYATAFYLSGEPRGLYQRIAGRSTEQEIVRGITGIRCRYLPYGRSRMDYSDFVTAEHILDWHQVVAVKCHLHAMSDPVHLRYGDVYRAQADREMTVMLRNPFYRLRTRDELSTVMTTP